MSSVASRLRASASKVALRLNREIDAPPKKKEARPQADKLADRARNIPSINPAKKAVAAIPKKMTPVEQGQRARARDTGGSNGAAPLSRNSANTASAAIPRKLSSVEMGKLFKSGDVKTISSAMGQNLTPVQKGELARMSDVATTGARAPAPRALNLTAVQQSGAAPLTPTPLSTTNVNNQPGAINSQPPAVTPYAYSPDGTRTETAGPLVPGAGSSPPLLDQNGNPIPVDQSSLSSTDAHQQPRYTPVVGDGDIPPPLVTEDNPYGLPTPSDNTQVEFAPDGSSYILGTPVTGGTHAEGEENINIENQINKDSVDIKTPTGEYETANGFLVLEKPEVPIDQLVTPEEYKEYFHSGSREYQDSNMHPDDYYDLYRGINPEYDPDGSGWNDQGSIALAPPQAHIDQVQGELEAGDGSGAVTNLVNGSNLFGADLSTPGQPAEPWLEEWQDFQNSGAVAAAEGDPEHAFQIGVAEGVAIGVENNALGIAQMALSTTQFGADTSSFGKTGDILRGYTGRLPKWLDEFIPSAERGQETSLHTAQLAENMDAYVTSRAKDPSLFHDDMKQFFSEHWEELKDDHAAAAAQGPAAEAEWWGKVTGQAAVEIAMTAAAAADVARVARVTGGLVKLALDAGAEFTTAKLAEVSAYAKDLTSLANDVTADEMLSLTSYDELKSVQEELLAFEMFGEEISPATAEGRQALADLEEAQAAVNEAVEKAERLETPNNPPTLPPTGNPDVLVSTDAQSIYDSFDSSSALKEGNSSFVQLTSNVAPHELAKHLANLTDKYGVEFAVFKRGNKTILARGDANGIDINSHFKSKIQSTNVLPNRWKLIAHTQPGYDNASLRASKADQDILKLLNQTGPSAIINSRGQSAQFTQTVPYDANSVRHINRKTFATQADFFAETNKANKLSPYAEYKFNGYTYETDSKGRVVSASGELRLQNSRGPNRPNGGLQTTIGHQGRPAVNGKYPDVGFHLIGHQFGGEINYLNVVPGDAILNGNGAGKYGNLENRLAAKLKAGHRVEVNIQINYDGATIAGRPESFTVNYRMTTQPYGNTFGQWTSQTWLNK